MASFTKYSVQDWIIVLFFSYALVTIFNIFLNRIFPAIPIAKTGIALILLLVSIVLVMLFTVSKDGFDKQDIYSMLVVLGIMVAIYFVVKHFVPELFSILPEGFKQAFSIVP